VNEMKPSATFLERLALIAPQLVGTAAHLRHCTRGFIAEIRATACLAREILTRVGDKGG